MSDASESAAGDGEAAIDATAVVTGLIGGVSLPVLQYALWEFTADGPLSVPGAESLEAEMAVFVAVGVAVPAGGIALLYEDDPLAGVVGAVTFVAASFGLGAVVSVPEWFRTGLVGTALLLVAVAVVEGLSADRDRTTG